MKLEITLRFNTSDDIAYDMDDFEVVCLSHKVSPTAGSVLEIGDVYTYVEYTLESRYAAYFLFALVDRNFTVTSMKRGPLTQEL